MKSALIWNRCVTQATDREIAADAVAEASTRIASLIGRAADAYCRRSDLVVGTL
jgi:hypothetical protein